MGIIFEDIQSGNESSIDTESVSMESTAGGIKRKSSARDTATRANLIICTDRVELTAARAETNSRSNLNGRSGIPP